MDTRLKFRIGDKLPLTLEDVYNDEQASAAQADSYSIIGASVRGRLHHYNNIPRDDAFAARFNGVWLAVGVADGAGSRSRSRYGASFSSHRLCGRLFQAVARVRGKVHDHGGASGSLKDVVLQAFRHTRVDLEQFASKHGVGLDELHCTLLGLILNTATGEVGVGQIGDGLILGLNETTEAKPLAEPAATDDLGASYFLTQADWEDYLYVNDITAEKAKHFSAFYLMTDGVANDCQYGPPTDILKRWANDMNREIRLIPSLEKTAERLKNYLASYQAKGSFDDRTLVVVYTDQKDVM